MPSAHDLLWITVAMVGARSLAMALNRLIDAELDARNPRTAARELPSGRADARGGRRASASPRSRVFLVAVWQLDPIVRWLWPIPVAAFVVYPYLKRFTWLCHLWLGACDGLAAGRRLGAVSGDLPGSRGRSARRSRSGSRGSTSSTRCSTSTSTGAQGLHSWATRFGVRGVFLGARALHALTVAALVVVGLGLAVDWAYWMGVAAVAALLAYEHSLVRPGDLRRLDAAFFTMNGVISITFLVFVLVDVL